MTAVLIAIKGKGVRHFLGRGTAILRTYGPTAGAMDRRLARITSILREHGAAGTFPTTASALARNPRVARRYLERGMEFALHGERHVDHAALSRDEQAAAIRRGLAMFARHEIPCRGFRGPYLRANEWTVPVLRDAGLRYDATQAYTFEAAEPLANDGYRRGLDFYGARRAADEPVVPELADDVVRIPYSLPDDEAVVDRLALEPAGIARLWSAMFEATLARGELFSLALHPERTARCAQGLTAVLAAARASGATWIARLDEIDAWWRARAAAAIAVGTSDGRLRATVEGAPDARLELWGAGGAAETPAGRTLDLPPGRRPTIHVTQGSAPGVAAFLANEGFVLDPTPADAGLVVDRPRFERAERRALLTELEGSGVPLLRIARWPHGNRAALAVSGDIDAFTGWHYPLRAGGR